MRPAHTVVLLLGLVLWLPGAATAGTFIGGMNDDSEHRVVGADTTPDGGFVVAFQADRIDSDPPDEFSVVVKLGATGSVEWERWIYGDGPGGPIQAIDAAADGTLFVVGRVDGNRATATRGSRVSTHRGR